MLMLWLRRRNPAVSFSAPVSSIPYWLPVTVAIRWWFTFPLAPLKLRAAGEKMGAPSLGVVQPHIPGQIQRGGLHSILHQAPKHPNAQEAGQAVRAKQTSLTDRGLTVVHSRESQTGAWSSNRVTVGLEEGVACSIRMRRHVIRRWQRRWCRRSS